MTAQMEAAATATHPLDGADAMAAMGAIELAAALTESDVEAIVDAVTTAYHGGAAQALGYSGEDAWAKCCRVYLADVQVWSTPADRRPIVRALRESGMSARDVAVVIKRSTRTVERDMAGRVDSSDSDVAMNQTASAGRATTGAARLAPWERALATARIWTLRHGARRLTERQIADRLNVSQARVHRLLVDADKRTSPGGAGDRAALEALARRVGDDVEQIDPLEAARALGYDVPAATADREADYCSLVARVAREVGKVAELLAAVEAGLDSSATPGQQQAAREALGALDVARRRHLEIRGRLGEPCPELAPGGRCSRSGVLG